MPLTLTLRRDEASSPFRNQLIKLITTPGADRVFLCSGYIDVAVFDDELISSLKVACKGGKLVLLAGKLTKSEYKDWPQLYDQTIAKLSTAGIGVSAYEVPFKNWHAKIALRLKGQLPIAAIMGSSNLTNPAVTINWENWNYECDVTMWEDPSLTKHFRDPLSRKDPFEYAELILDPDMKEQPSVGERLAQLYADLKKLRKEGKIVPRKAT